MIGAIIYLISNIIVSILRFFIMLVVAVAQHNVEKRKYEEEQKKIIELKGADRYGEEW